MFTEIITEFMNVKMDEPHSILFWKHTLGILSQMRPKCFQTTASDKINIRRTENFQKSTKSIAQTTTYKNLGEITVLAEINARGV